MATTKQSSLLLYLIMVFGFTMGYLYTLQSDPTAAVPVLESRYQLSTLKSLESARIDQSLFSNEQFRLLRVFGSLPVQSSGSGKDNPFQ